jgi:hypothetical protein
VSAAPVRHRPRRPGAPRTTEEASEDAREARGLAVGAVAAGWFLFALVGPVAVFLTWFGDCAREPCPVASQLDRTIYTADLLAWLALPGLAWLAHRGWRLAAAAIVAIGLAIVAQGFASVIGARGFQTFFLVIPAGGLIMIGGGLEFAATRLGVGVRR